MRIRADPNACPNSCQKHPHQGHIRQTRLKGFAHQRGAATTGTSSGGHSAELNKAGGNMKHDNYTLHGLTINRDRATPSPYDLEVV